ncbi:MAG: menaquinone reductase molybdopterin-binding-like subunit QrcB [Desulfovibrionaceae bacterium]
MGLNRRAFIQLVVGGGIGTLFTPALWKVTDDISIWTQNWSWIPRLTKGAQESVPALCKMIPSGTPVRVLTVGGQPYGTAGDPENPLSGGGMDALSAVAVPMMRSPARVKGPMKKTGEGSYAPITWDDAAALFIEKAKAAGASVAAISGDETGTANEVISGFLAALGSDAYYMMPSAMTAASKAYNGLMGGQGQIGYDVANSDFVLSIGAELLDSFGPVVANQQAFAAQHPTGEDATAAWIYAGPVAGRTAAVSDQFVPVKAGALTDFALGLAYILIRNGATLYSSDFGALQSLLASNYSPDKVAAATGLDKQVLVDLAGKLAAAGSPVVVADFGQNPATVAAGVLLNMLLGRVNVPGGMTVLAEAPSAVPGGLTASARCRKDLLVDLAAGTFAPKLLLVYEANPFYALPGLTAAAEGLKKAGFTVAFSTYLDETAAQADLVLPAPHSLERADDILNPFGIGAPAYVVGAPAAQPDLDVMATPDFLLTVAGNLGVDLGFESFAQVLEAKAGQVEQNAGLAYPDALSLPVAALAGKAKGKGAYALAALTETNFGTPTCGIPPHNTVTIRDTELQFGTMFVKMNADTAKAAGVKNGDKVKLAAAGGDCVAKVHVDAGVAPETVAAYLGFGHTAFDEFSKGKGDNVYKVLTVSSESGGSAWAGSTVDIAKL